MAETDQQLASTVCAATRRCAAKLHELGTNCSCRAVDRWRTHLSAANGPNGDGCVLQDPSCTMLMESQRLRLAHVRGTDEAGCFLMLVHALNPPYHGRWVNEGDVVSNSIRSSGSWEPELSTFAGIEKLAGVRLPRRGTLLDIGSQIGTISFAFAARHYRVFAIEPMLRNRLAMTGTACASPLLHPRVTVLPVAIVAPDALRPCKVSSGWDNRGNGELRCGPSVGVCGRQIRGSLCTNVATSTLDALLAATPELEAVDVVKLDVEGSECMVLEHGTTLFSRFRPGLLLVEARLPHTAHCIGRAALAHGYHLKANIPKFNIYNGLAVLTRRNGNETLTVSCTGHQGLCGNLTQGAKPYRLKSLRTTSL
jgi:FkbM family methyltransferase